MSEYAGGSFEPPDPAQNAESVADHEHVYRCQDCGEIGRGPERPVTQTAEWSGSLTCFHCGQSWVIGSHIIGSTAHVCPTHSDGSECGHV